MSACVEWGYDIAFLGGVYGWGTRVVWLLLRGTIKFEPLLASCRALHVSSNLTLVVSKDVEGGQKKIHLLYAISKAHIAEMAR